MIVAKVPDTITSWIASAFAMSDIAGLGVSKPTSLKVFQPFFVSLTLPYSVIRGEEVSIITTVFNYEKKCLTVSVTLLDLLMEIIILLSYRTLIFFSPFIIQNYPLENFTIMSRGGFRKIRKRGLKKFQIEHHLAPCPH